MSIFDVPNRHTPEGDEIVSISISPNELDPRRRRVKSPPVDASGYVEYVPERQFSASGEEVVTVRFEE